MCGISPGPGPAGPESGPIFEEFTGPGPASKTLVPSKWSFFKKNWVFGSRKLDFSHTCSNNYFIKFSKWTSSVFPNFYKIFGFFQKNIRFLPGPGPINTDFAHLYCFNSEKFPFGSFFCRPDS